MHIQLAEDLSSVQKVLVVEDPARIAKLVDCLIEVPNDGNMALAMLL